METGYFQTKAVNQHQVAKTLCIAFVKSTMVTSLLGKAVPVVITLIALAKNLRRYRKKALEGLHSKIVPEKYLAVGQ